MGVIWHKVWRDLTHNLPRTGLAVLSIAAGVFALGLAFGGLDVVHTQIEADKLTTHPAHLTFRNGLAQQATFNQALVEAARQRPGVAEAEGETLLPIRWKREGETEWRKGTLVARDDYTQQQINRVDLLSGQWPAAVKHALAAERKTAAYYGAPPGAAIWVEAGSSERRLPIVGTVRKPYVLPPEFGGDATFYAAPETVTWLTGLEGFNKLRVRLTDFGLPAGDQAHRDLRDWLERLGFADTGTSAAVDEFQGNGMQNAVEGVFLILVVMGILSLGLSAFLITNTLNALLAQQIWQIGVMKVLGARFGQVAGAYLMMALIYGLLALPLAAPAGMWGAYGLAGWMLAIAYNLTLPGPMTVSPAALAAQVVVSVAVPMLAALPPIWHAARLTPREAISSYGVGLGYGTSPFDRLLENVRGLPRPLALSLRNTFRRKGRLTLTLLTLTFVGAVFMMVTSTRESFERGIDLLMNVFQYDGLVVFTRPQRSMALAEVAASVPGVTRSEIWSRQNARLQLANDAERDVGVYGAPPETAMFQPQVVSGRNLLPQDDHAILFNRNLAAEIGVQVGDTVTLTIAGQKTAWAVVGLILNATVGQNDNFVPFSTLTRAAGNLNEGNMLMVATAEHEAGAQARLVAALNQACAARHLETLSLQSASQFRQSGELMFSIVTLMLMLMVVVAAGVGGIGLAGTLSINVIERRREIGVLRAIGARPRDVLGLFVGEGLMVGGLSWLLALPFGYPAALLFSRALGQVTLGTPLDFRYSFSGTFLWLVLVLALAAAASLWPAASASRLTVRETLAYE